ncbi:MAG TPA: acyl-CoA dehydrogenase family protein [Acidimicrobiia bacterium]|nr:acyl-CoA dehydrogenase family protein [Acidimicrobiia bacterium]
MAATATTVTADEALVRQRIGELLDRHDPKTTDRQEFWGAQFDLGLAWVHFPEGYGGLGLSPKLQGVIRQELRTAGAPDNTLRNIIGLGMGGPVVATHGTEEQKQRLLRPLFTCEEIWCQLFSEPGAGSDVAGLATRAVRDGDEWVVNGQKVWTTLAHMAKWGMLVARTNPDVPKHEGMTYFIIDMEAEGVEVRPLRQMTGEAEFNEVYMTDVRIPDTMRVGAEGEGWRVAVTTLMNERQALGGDATVRRGGGPIAEAMRLWKERGHTDPVLRDRLVGLWVESEVQRMTAMRAAQKRAVGNPGPEGSTGKLATAELNKKVTELYMDLLGAEAMLYPIGYEMARPSEVSLVSGADPRKAFLRARANTIEGGTSEIMRNILGERILGLPGDPRADKGMPWSDVPRN